MNFKVLHNVRCIACDTTCNFNKKIVKTQANNFSYINAIYFNCKCAHLNLLIKDSKLIFFDYYIHIQNALIKERIYSSFEDRNLFYYIDNYCIKIPNKYYGLSKTDIKNISEYCKKHLTLL